MVLFVKTTGECYLDSAEWTSTDIQNKTKVIVTKYYEFLSKRLVKEHKKLQELQIKNQELAITRGTYLQEFKDKIDIHSKFVDKLLNAAQTLSSFLHLDMPELSLIESQKTQIVKAIDFNFVQQEIKEGDVWEDQMTRDFYQDIPDLKNLVPSACLESIGKGSLIELSLESLNALDEESVQDGSNMESVQESDSLQEEESIIDKESPQFETIQNILSSNVLNKEQIDQVAVDFALMNSKSTRKRLIRLLLQNVKAMSEFSSLYARLIAILHPFMPDISNAILDSILKQFKHQQKFRDSKFINEKLVVRHFRFI